MRLFAALCLIAVPTLAPADEAVMARAQKIVAGSCFLCHGMQGESATELFPRLAAQNEKYIAKQLANFKSGERRSEVMPRMVGALTPEDMRALGLYFSRQSSPPHAPVDARVDDLLRRMTLEEKVAQLLTVWQGKTEIFDAKLRFNARKAAERHPHGIGQFARPQDARGPVSPREIPSRSPRKATGTALVPGSK